MSLPSTKPLLSHEGATNTLKRYFEHLKREGTNDAQTFFLGMVKSMEELGLIDSTEALEWAERGADIRQ